MSSPGTQRPRQRDELFVADDDGSDRVRSESPAQRARARRAAGSTRGSAPARRTRFRCRSVPCTPLASAIVEKEADREPAENVAGSRLRGGSARSRAAARRARAAGTWRSRPAIGASSTRRGDASPRRRRRRPAARRSRPVSTSRSASTSVAIFVGERLDGGRVAGLDRRLQLRQIGDDARQPREVVDPGRAVLIDQRAGFHQPAPQIRLRLRRRALVDEIKRKAERQRSRAACRRGRCGW